MSKIGVSVGDGGGGLGHKLGVSVGGGGVFSSSSGAFFSPVPKADFVISALFPGKRAEKRRK